MAYEFITMQRTGKVLTILLNRPPTNPLSAAFGRELFDAFTEVDRMDDVTVVVITSALEKAFVAGADIKEMASMDRAASEAFSKLLQDANTMNNYGSSLIYGHPQAPTGARAIVEGIEELAMKGGGYLLFCGCAAGDTAASLVLKVG